MLRGYKVDGRWDVDGGGAVRVVDYAAGWLWTEDDRGEVRSGPVGAFTTVGGESGEQLVARLIRAPAVLRLWFGSLRESLVAASYVAISGFGETRAWEGDAYVLSDGCGSEGVIRFARDSCVAAVAYKDPWRSYDVDAAIRAMPEPVQRPMREVAALPLLTSGVGITALMFGEDGYLTSNEEWVTAYTFGAEIFRREMLTDEVWEDEAVEHYGLDVDVVRVASSLARLAIAVPHELRAAVGASLSKFVPPSSPYLNEAVELVDASIASAEQAKGLQGGSRG